MLSSVLVMMAYKYRRKSSFLFVVQKIDLTRPPRRREEVTNSVCGDVEHFLDLFLDLSKVLVKVILDPFSLSPVLDTGDWPAGGDDWCPVSCVKHQARQHISTQAKSNQAK